MKNHFYSLLSTLSLFACVEMAFSAVTVEPSNSSLKVNWEDIHVNRWQVVNEDGVECWRKDLNGGETSLEIPKIALDHNRTLNLYTNEGLKSFEIGKRENLSPLLKVQNNAVIYQLPIRTWSADGLGESLSGHLDKIDHTLLQKVKDLGADYIWMTGVLESASIKQTDLDVVKGNAGSYYAIHDSWDVAEEIGGLQAFEEFLDRAHSLGLRVMVDLVPNHTARSHRTDVVCKNLIDFGIQDNPSLFFNSSNDYYYLLNTTFVPPAQPGRSGIDGQFDRDVFRSGIQYEFPARVTGNDVINSLPSIHDWFETTKLNYGFDLITRQAHYSPMPSTWPKVLDIAKYWVSKGVDGFRVDFAHPVPIEFWQYFSSNLKNYFPEVFLLAEAYENDEAMKLPGYSNQALMQAGFDSVYNSELYWGLRHGNIRPNFLASLDESLVSSGKTLTNYMENHDEIRVASSFFAPHIGNKYERGEMGLHFSTWMTLMPNHFLIHGGQEVLEEAEIYGPFAGNNGKTSIFDFVYQTEIKKWRYNQSDGQALAVRSMYEKLFQLKHSSPFDAAHLSEAPSYMDLSRLNVELGLNHKILSYIRFEGEQKYLVVLNSDMYNSHNVTIHFTKNNGFDSKGVLATLGVENNGTWYEFVEVMFRNGWVPRDPAFDRAGVPGSALYRSSGIPSGLYLGEMKPGQAYVLKLESIVSQ